MGGHIGMSKNLAADMKTFIRWIHLLPIANDDGAKMIIIDLPEFYCLSDESAFFKWLTEISAVTRTRGVGRKLEVTFKEPIGREDFYELVGLMTRYGLRTDSLLILIEKQNDPWFRDSRNYWYSGVYGQATKG